MVCRRTPGLRMCSVATSQRRLDLRHRAHGCRWHDRPVVRLLGGGQRNAIRRRRRSRQLRDRRGCTRPVRRPMEPSTSIATISSPTTGPSPTRFRRRSDRSTSGSAVDWNRRVTPSAMAPTPCCRRARLLRRRHPGAAYLYRYTVTENPSFNDSLILIGEAPIPHPGADGKFGFAVALDGDSLIVSGPGADRRSLLTPSVGHTSIATTPAGFDRCRRHVGAAAVDVVDVRQLRSHRRHRW